ncbi:MAG: TetR/AcrR family transcriptional regulator [Candidatus Sericytochromatia bacterium]|nr:TetR/AcrR family transcriptional regulator [Candidatus Sericytochromatia bacterium]
MEFKNKDEVNAVLLALRSAYHEKKSYSKIKISDISEKSNIHIGTIYAHFTNKDDIAVSLIKKDIYDIFITYDEEIEDGMPASEKLKIFLSLQMEFLGSDLKMIRELLPFAIQPFSTFSDLLLENRKKYNDFLYQLFLNNFKKSSFIFRNVTLPIITNTFLAFNLSVLQFWLSDKSEGKQSTLNYIEKGVKNFMIMSTLL